MEIDPKLGEPVWALPFDQLRVGMSFFIPTNKPNAMKRIVEDRAAEIGCRIKATVTTKESYLGVRVWRVA
jgi:hypothetical protein